MCVQGGVSVGAVDVAPIQDQEVGWAEQGQQDTENVQSNSDAEVGTISVKGDMVQTISFGARPYIYSFTPLFDNLIFLCTPTENCSQTGKKGKVFQKGTSPPPLVNHNIICDNTLTLIFVG